MSEPGEADAGRARRRAIEATDTPAIPLPRTRKEVA